MLSNSCCGYHAVEPNPGGTVNRVFYFRICQTSRFFSTYFTRKNLKNDSSRILKGKNPGAVVDEDHGAWYQELFGPSVTVGLIKPADLAGYRSGPVFIRGSMHVPLNRDAVMDAMPALFELLKEEANPAVRVVLGHFIFVYIHPYMDGNGRVGRFLMNAMLIAGGYPWTVIPLEERRAYMDAPEDASVRLNIEPFAQFIGGLVSKRVKGGALPKIPNS